MADAFANHETSLDSPGHRAAAVTPNDSTDLTNAARALWVGGAGNLAVVTTGGDTVTLTAATAGSVVPVRVARVLSTGTTATAIVALW